MFVFLGITLSFRRASTLDNNAIAEVIEIPQTFRGALDNERFWECAIEVARGEARVGSSCTK